MRSKFVPEHIGGKFEGEEDVFASCKPSDGGAIFRRCLSKEGELIQR